jgi:hypothetical protein
MSGMPGISLDRHTGAVSLPGLLVETSLTREAFLASPAAAEREIFTQNEPWCSYKLSKVPHADTEFIVILFFHGERLTDVHLFDAYPPLTGESWADWSEEKELARKERHEEWLRQWDAPVGKYSWGEVWSEYDPRSGSSDIGIRYRDPDEPRGFQRLFRRLFG